MLYRTLLSFTAGIVLSHAGPAPNVLLICIDDLRPELKCFGAGHIHSPSIDSLAAQGRVFRRHYVQAPTCGASRYTLLTGRYGGAGNSALFDRAGLLRKDPQGVPPSMPAYFRAHGYTTVSVGKVSHHPGGLGGTDWDDREQREMPDSWDRHLLPAGLWQHPRGWMHGLADGEIRDKAGAMDVFQALDRGDGSYPDGPNTDLALEQLADLAAGEKPFFLAFGILRPHLPFGAPKNYLDHYRDSAFPKTPHPGKPAGKTTWHRSGEFMKYNRWGKNPNTDAGFAATVRRHYAACVTYADAQVGKVLAQLDELDLRKETIIVVWGDHGWHLGEHSVWGKHTLFEESLRSPLVLSYRGVARPGTPTDAVVETLDIFPTLADLAGLPRPAFAQGETLRPLLDDPGAPGHDAYSYRHNAKTVRTATHRLIAHKGGHLELYDHTSRARETVNLAGSEPALAADLLQKVESRLGAGWQR